MNFKLRIWRQTNPDDQGRLVEYEASDIPADASFLEMLDILNNRLEEKGEEGIAFDSDCREGICGMCSLMINGVAHGPGEQMTSCQLRMRSFREGETITVEPWRAKPFPVVRDLVSDRTALDRIIQAGGFVSVRTGAPPDANALPVPKDDAEWAMNAAACIGCGACVAACKNASAMLFVSAKVGHLRALPQGKPEKYRRVLGMVRKMDEEGFGGCTNQLECEAVCPAKVSAEFITEMNRDYAVASARELFGAV